MERLEAARLLDPESDMDDMRTLLDQLPEAMAMGAEALREVDRLSAENRGLMDALDRATKESVAKRSCISREWVERMRSRWITVVEVDGKQYSKCAACQNALDGLEDAYLFCPSCGAPMTDEAVEKMMERMEGLNDDKE